MKKSKFWGIAALVAVMGLLVMGCGDNDDPDSSGSIPDALVGSWGGDEDNPALVINADGSGTFSGNACTWSVSGDRLILTIDQTGGITASGSVKYEITADGKLKVSDAQSEDDYGIGATLWTTLVLTSNMGGGLENVGGGSSGGEAPPAPGEQPKTPAGWTKGLTNFKVETGDDPGEINYSFSATIPAADSYTLCYVEGKQTAANRIIQNGDSYEVEPGDWVFWGDPNKTYSFVIIATKSGLADAISAVWTATTKAGSNSGGEDPTKPGEKTCTVTFDADGGSPAPAPITVERGDTINEPVAMTKDGYVFGGWYDPYNNYYAVDFPYMVYQDVTLSARWVDCTPLTENEWAGGYIEGWEEQWFSFTATASPQYIHIDLDTLPQLYVQVYDSNGNTVGDETSFSSYNDITSTARLLTIGQSYSIRVSSGSSYQYYTGTYQIAFNSSPASPSVTLITPLTENEWTDGYIETSSDERWYSFTATASPQYIHIRLGTSSWLYVQVYDSNGTAGEETYMSSSSSSLSCSLTIGGDYYIKVRGSYGTYKIKFNAATPLTENEWADGNIETSSDEQWYRFTATANEQYIHIDGTSSVMSGLYVQVYGSDGTTRGAETEFYRFNQFISRSLTTGQTYYIRVRPYISSYTGTYRIAFNADSAAPVEE